MGVTDEMREAARHEEAKYGSDAEGDFYSRLYLAMRALDPQIVAMGDELFALRRFLDERGELVEDGLVKELATLRPVVEAAARYEAFMTVENWNGMFAAIRVWRERGA